MKWNYHNVVLIQVAADFPFIFPNPMKFMNLKNSILGFNYLGTFKRSGSTGSRFVFPIAGSVSVVVRFLQSFVSTPIPGRFLHYRVGSVPFPFLNGSAPHSSRVGFYITSSVPLRFVSCRCRFSVPGSVPRPPCKDML